MPGPNTINLQNNFGETTENTILPQGAENQTGALIGLAGGNKIYAGEGVPTFEAPESSIYIRGDGANLNELLYVNTDGVDTWSPASLTGGAAGLATALTGFSAAAGVVSASDSILVAFNKLAGNNGTRVQKISVGYAALNTAGTGVAALFGSAIPDNAIIRQVYYDVTTTFADNGTAGNADSSTISLGLNSAVDVKAAVAISNGANPWDVGIVAGIPVGTAATMIKLTAARQLSATFTAGTGDATALTAGAMDVFVSYDLGS